MVPNNKDAYGKLCDWVIKVARSDGSASLKSVDICKHDDEPGCSLVTVELSTGHLNAVTMKGAVTGKKQTEIETAIFVGLTYLIELTKIIDMGLSKNPEGAKLQ